ncbi:MAG: 2'-5' RNA ligase family protein [Deltaproteobacteria bacterium]|nr:2'-5' RNA ligase family protein [Deltaproteobacteria bacterium]
MTDPSKPRGAAPTIPHARRQLTLFVPATAAATLEALRLRLDPIQATLIAAHVTLCREDELVDRDVEAMLERVRAWDAGPLRLAFGAATRFSAHGVLLPCEHGSDEFQRLRRWILDDPRARPHGAHITLAHPRNPRAPTNVDTELGALPATLRLEFPTVTRIEQVAGAPWTSLREAWLGAAHGRA